MFSRPRLPSSKSEPVTRPTPSELRPAPRPAGLGSEDTYTDLKNQVQARLIADLDPNLDLDDTELVRRTIGHMYSSILDADRIALNRIDRERLFERIVAEIVGYGPIQPLLEDESVTEIMVNGPRQIYIERGGKLQRAPVTFKDDEHLLRIIHKIVHPLGRRIDESSPMVDARLPDGSRVNAIIAPLSLVGPVLTIRKFKKVPFTAQDLIDWGTVTPEIIEFMDACVKGRLNILVSGGTGSGKTTLLNVLSGFIPSDERIVTIEDAAELQLKQDHVIRLESRPPNLEGKGQIAIRQLVMNALRMRPDRIVVGEVRGGEALDMLQAMNTGHDGSMTSCHANNPRDATRRLETLVLMGSVDLPLRAIREQIASAIDLIIQQERLQDGSRKVTKVTEVQGMEGDVITMQDVFVFDQTGVKDGKVVGRIRPTGTRPKFYEKLESHGFSLPASVFGGPRGATR